MVGWGGDVLGVDGRVAGRLLCLVSLFFWV